MNKKLITYIYVSAAIITICTGVFFSIDYFRKDETKLDGNWEVEFYTEKSSYQPYIGMSLTYKLYFIQKKDEFEAIGETWYVNGKELPFSRHRNLTIKGTIKKRIAKGSYILVGELRESYGSINVNVSKDGLTFEGNFEGTAATTTGRINGIKK